MKLADHHHIDGFPELDELPAKDVAFDTFRMNYPLPATSAKMADDGLSMSYRLRFEMNSENYLKVAHFAIICKGLPLEAKLDELVVGGRVFETNLIITYTGQ